MKSRQVLEKDMEQLTTCLIDLYLFRREKLYCAFIDYRKAFDSVNRVLLWQKLLRNGIDGKMLTIIKNLYKNAKSCVRNGNTCSEYFSSNIGVRQGENLSPLLFSIFLNDLTEFLSHAYNGLTDVCNISHLLFDNDDIEVFLNYIYFYVQMTLLYLLKLLENYKQVLMLCTCTAKHGICKLMQLKLMSYFQKIEERKILTFCTIMDL